jgi:hypothetical protein
MKSALLPGSDDNIPDVLGASCIIEKYQSQTKRIRHNRLVGHTEILNDRNQQSPVRDPEFPEANHQSPIGDPEFQKGNLQSPSGYPDYRSDPWKNKEILVPLKVVEGREAMAELGTASQPSYSTPKSIHTTTDITNAPPIGTEMAGEPLIDESRTPLSDESLHNSNDFFELTGSEWYDTDKGIWSESISVVLQGRTIVLSDDGSIMLSYSEKFHLFLPVLSVSPADNTLSPRIKCFLNCTFIGVHAVINTENKEKVQAMIYSLRNGDKRIIVAKDNFGYVSHGDDLLPSGANADIVSLKASPVKKLKYVIDIDAKNEDLSTDEVEKLLKEYQGNKYHVKMPFKRKREDDDTTSNPNKKNAKTSPLVNPSFLKQFVKFQGTVEQIPEAQLYSNRSISASFVLSEKKQKGKPTSENVVNGYKCCHCKQFFQQMSTLYAHCHEYKDGSAQDVSRHRDMLPYLEVFKFFKAGNNKRDNENTLEYVVHKHLRAANKTCFIPFEIFTKNLIETRNGTVFTDELRSSLTLMWGAARNSMGCDRTLVKMLETPEACQKFLNGCRLEMDAFMQKMIQVNWYDLFLKVEHECKSSPKETKQSCIEFYKFLYAILDGQVDVSEIPILKHVTLNKKTLQDLGIKHSESDYLYVA